jgi:hypothetical protein
MNSYGKLALDEAIFDFVSKRLSTCIQQMKSTDNLKRFVGNVVLVIKNIQVGDRMSSIATDLVDSGHIWENV